MTACRRGLRDGSAPMAKRGGLVQPQHDSFYQFPASSSSGQSP